MNDQEKVLKEFDKLEKKWGPTVPLWKFDCKEISKLHLKKILESMKKQGLIKEKKEMFIRKKYFKQYDYF